MPIPLPESSDILPPKLLEQYEAELQKRLGGSNWLQRKKIEEANNPKGRITFSKLLRWVVHNLSYSLITIVLAFAGKRKEARDNCWKTEYRSLDFYPKHPVKNEHSGEIRVLHLSDFHIDTNLQQAAKWVDMIRELTYDLTVITGDYLNAYTLPQQAHLEALSTILSAIQGPKYGILGNHDCALTTYYLESMGLEMLLNESVIISLEKSGARIQITGIDDPHFFKTDDISKATAEVKSTDVQLKLLLSHAPKHNSTIEEQGFDLCLSGHTHGGQLCTRKGTPILRNGPYPLEQVADKWRKGTLEGYTSRGTGTGRLAFRLNCPPEITVHTVHL